MPLVAVASRDEGSGIDHMRLPARTRTNASSSDALTICYSLICAVGVLGGSSIAGAQRPIEVDDRTTCERCTITVRKVLSLTHKRPEHKFLAAPSSIAVDSRGRFVVTLGSRGVPRVYDATGRLLRTIGRVGSGPGQYRDAMLALVGSMDTLVVLDRANARMSVVGPNLNFVRSAPLPNGVFAATTTQDRTLVVNAHVMDFTRVALPLHSFDAVGNYVKSFGDNDEPFIPGAAPPMMRNLSSARAGGFWSSSVLGRYIVEQWSTSGEALTRISRRPPWFPWTEQPKRGFSRESPPSPRIISIVEDPHGLLWVVARVSDRRWQEAIRWSPNADGEAAMIPEILDHDLVDDTVIDVLDPANGRLLVSQRFDTALLQFIAPGRIARALRLGDGTVEVQIHQVDLRKP